VFPNINAVSLRMTNTYGPRHQMRNRYQGFLNWFIKLAMDGEEITVYEPGRQLRDFNYIEDVVDALLKVAVSEKTNGEVYNLGSCINIGGNVTELGGGVISVKEVAEKIVRISNELTGKNAVLKMIPYPEEKKKVEVGDIKMDITKIYNDTGWKPQTELEIGLRKTIEFYKKNKDKYW